MRKCHKVFGTHTGSFLVPEVPRPSDLVPGVGAPVSPVPGVGLQTRGCPARSDLVPGVPEELRKLCRHLLWETGFPVKVDRARVKMISMAEQSPVDHNDIAQPNLSIDEWTQASSTDRFGGIGQARVKTC